MSRDRENKGRRQVALASPRVLVPAVVAMVLVALLLVPHLASGRVTVPRPGQTRTYDAFAQAVRAMDVRGVQMYRDTLYVTPLQGAPYLVQDVSPEFTIGLLTRYRIPVQGIPQPPTPGPILGFGVLVALLLPYLLLGWLTVMLVRAAGGAADVDPEAHSDPTRCPECSRPVPQDSRFCQHCAHPVQWTAQIRQCSACGQQVWRNDRFCRSCGRALPATTPEARKARQEAIAGVEPTSPADRAPGQEAVGPPGGTDLGSLARSERSGRPGGPAPSIRRSQKHGHS